MPKKRVTKSPPDIRIGNGTVYVGLGLKISQNFQTTDFNLGVNLPIADGEEASDAVDRVHETVSKLFADKADPSFDMLGRLLNRRKR